MTILYAGFVDISADKGDGVHARELVRNLRELKNRVIVVAHSKTRKSDADFHNTGSYEYGRSIFSRLFLFLVSLLRSAKQLLLLSPGCDVLYMRDYLFCSLGLVPKFLHSKRVVWEVNGIAGQEMWQKYGPRSALLLPFVRLLEALASMTADAIVAVSRGIKDALTRLGCSLSKINLVENGVNVEMFSEAVDKSCIESQKKRLGITSSVPVLCYVGAIRPWQGLDVLLEVAPMIKRELGEVRFLIVGGGEGLGSLKEDIRTKGLLAMFVVTGSVPYDKMPLMVAMSDICLAPFAKGRAASPMKIYEYMAAGKPFISSRIAGLEFIEDNRLGVLVAPGESAELARAILALLKDPGSAREMALRAQDYARRNCTWAAVARKVMNVCS